MCLVLVFGVFVVVFIFMDVFKGGMSLEWLLEGFWLLLLLFYDMGFVFYLVWFVDFCELFENFVSELFDMELLEKECGGEFKGFEDSGVGGMGCGGVDDLVKKKK